MVNKGSNTKLGPTEDAVGGRKAMVMGVAANEYVLPRKEGGFPGLVLKALAS